MTTPPIDALTVALKRKYRCALVDGPGSPLVSEFEDAAAEVAMSVVRPYLEGLAAEVELLRATRGSSEPPGAMP
jgi:hypothetical protein